MAISHNTFYPQIFTGGVKTYPGHEPSAIQKTEVSTPLQLTKEGFSNDEQADRRFHGGVDRALCHYPREHYDYWETQYPTSNSFRPAAFGENLSTYGLTEENAFMGDIYQLGEAIIQITQPRSPCYKLNYHFAIPDLSQKLQESTYCGWLYRVITEGVVMPDAELKLLTRLSNLSVKRAIEIAFLEPFSEATTEQLLSCPGLSASWTQTMQKRLLTQKIESFERRLFNP